MKIKKGFILKELGGQYVAVATGEASRIFQGVVKLNGTGAFLWGLLEKGATRDELVNGLLAEYDVERDRAESSVSAFLEKLKTEKMLEE